MLAILFLSNSVEFKLLYLRLEVEFYGVEFYFTFAVGYSLDTLAREEASALLDFDLLDFDLECAGSVFLSDNGVTFSLNSSTFRS